MTLRKRTILEPALQVCILPPLFIPKRGLPHVHMLIWLDSASKRNLTSNVDKYVSAEIPDPELDPVGYQAVSAFMMHGPLSHMIIFTSFSFVFLTYSLFTAAFIVDFALLLHLIKQLHVYNSVMESVQKKEGGVFFVYGSGGCGKTYMWRTLISKLRSERKIVLPVASSGIAATLMPGGRTAHSRFKIPIVLDELSMCSISHTSDIAELIKKTDLIIWDEAPMQHRFSFECLDRSLRDIMKAVDPGRFDLPFGGITIVFGGDFRQILPVIPRAGRGEIVSSCITNSKLWKIATLKLKVGVVVMLMRNLNQTLGLCNGTRMMVTKCLKHCVECEVISGHYKGTKHFIPRMELSPTETRLPFRIIRKQMPLQICYAMTINKSQGQSLEKVGLFLPKGVFTHGQLYVAISRVTSPDGLKIFIDDMNGNSTNITPNVVYKEIFYNVPVI
ncbi:hypothetical protein DCAR_0208962 [Daucus carota subsp. sativus]|uniref:ATP-dependent DNA helicase n=1 Tax=Daucus carota subsp. sativus TaxID=79200 RepID=A0AAF0WIF4_DAUCS|nr:hypothetical protein DCAR_0208962 [Daucus carota subsp. sativus]